MSPPDSSWSPESVRVARVRHWRGTQRLTAVLLLAWFAVAFVVTWFARDLDFPFFGWPFSFWVAAQGGTLVFVALLVIYAHRMARHDSRLARESASGPQAAEPADRAGEPAAVATLP